ncbi:hypothetical protein [Anabaena sp. AL93]|nr:hypothetical protein [Anabaena sp. AL93]
MQSLFESKFNTPLSHKQLKTLLRRIRPLIAETKSSEDLTYALAKRVGLINLTDKINRLVILEELVHKSIEGSPHEVQTAKGTAITINKKDFTLALNALKEIRNEVGKETNETINCPVIIGDSVPPNHPDYQELETDEDL